MYAGSCRNISEQETRMPMRGQGVAVIARRESQGSTIVVGERVIFADGRIEDKWNRGPGLRVNGGMDSACPSFVKRSSQ